MLQMSEMGLPEDLDVTGLKQQDQEILLYSHRPIPLSFIPFYLATTSNP